ncbi:hypothetical protein CEXT_798041 [Caerostris extrusa]|uniref:Uncharacterized protein n=1 Tax=Caerostris extrusa TaxID=172846 RepID=A0AAV4V6Y6_CAEEX|nr:hypothetical protein CEXT_798041 [Caerostris extrusa]
MPTPRSARNILITGHSVLRASDCNLFLVYLVTFLLVVLLSSPYYCRTRCGQSKSILLPLRGTYQRNEIFSSALMRCGTGWFGGDMVLSGPLLIWLLFLLVFLDC